MFKDRTPNLIFNVPDELYISEQSKLRSLDASCFPENHLKWAVKFKRTTPQKDTRKLCTWTWCRNSAGLLDILRQELVHLQEALLWLSAGTFKGVAVFSVWFPDDAQVDTKLRLRVHPAMSSGQDPPMWIPDVFRTHRLRGKHGEWATGTEN